MREVERVLDAAHSLQSHGIFRYEGTRQINLRKEEERERSRAEQAERAGKIIKSVHDFVRRRDRAREAIAPRRLIEAVMPLVSLQARKLGVQVLTQVNESCEPVLCDRTMVEQVLLNLARNGMQAMQEVDKSQHPEKVLLLRVQWAAANAHSRWVEFAVIDHGEGISKQVAQQLFTPFFTTKTEGMGLGLSVCRTVIEQHGGVLDFEAVLPQGTIFTFTLPVATAALPDTTALSA